MARAAAPARRMLRWGVPTVLVLAVVTFFGVRAVDASGAESDRYAIVPVTRGTVTQSYTGSGAVAKTDQETASFPASGTVTKVDVKVGDRVEAGDELAEIDNTQLRIAVITAKQTVADAEVALEKAQDAEEAEASASASASASPTASATASPSPRASASPSASASPRRTGTSSGGASPSRPSPSTPDVGALSRRVAEAQAALARLNAAAAADLTAQQTRCAALSTGAATGTPGPTVSATPSASVTPSPTPTSTPTGTATPSPSTTPSASASASPVPSTDPETLRACIAAVVATQQAQVGVADQQTQLDLAVKALVTGVQAAGSGMTGSGTGSTPSGSTPSSSSSATRSGGTPAGTRAATAAPSSAASSSAASSSARTAGGGATALTVPSAEAAVTKAQLALDAAEAKLEAATMVAPISGTVSAVPFTKGATASAGDQVVVTGKSAVQVSMSVPEAAFRTLRTGMSATISTPGGGRATGKVTRIGLLPSTSSTGTTGAAASAGATTWPVVVSASGSAASTLPDGAAASVVVRLQTSTDVLVVPVSAVTRSGTSGTVRVLDQGQVSTRPVTLGAVGAATVEVTQGLTEGQQLVIADNTTALPTATTRRAAAGLAGGAGPGGGPPPGAR